MKSFKLHLVAILAMMMVVGVSHTASATSKGFEIKVDNSTFDGRRAVNRR